MEKKNLPNRNFQKSLKNDQSMDSSKLIMKKKQSKFQASRTQDNYKINVRQIIKIDKQDRKIVKVSSKLPPKPKKVISVEIHSNFNYEKPAKKRVSFFGFVTVYQDCDLVRKKIY